MIIILDGKTLETALIDMSVATGPVWACDRIVCVNETHRRKLLMPFSQYALDEDDKRRTGLQARSQIGRAWRPDLRGERRCHRSVGPGDPTYRREKVSGLFFGSYAGAEG